MKKMKTGKSLGLVRYPILLILLLLTVSCRPKEETIFFLGPLTGRYSNMGQESRDGLILAMEEYNSTHGGEDFLLVTRDDENSAERAAAVVMEALERDISIIVGPMTSTLSLAVVDLVKDTEAVLISPTASTEELSGKDDGFFRLVEAYTQEGRHLARFAREEWGLTKLAAVYDLGNQAYSEGWLSSLEKDFMARGGVIVSRSVLDTSKTGDHGRVAREIMEENPEVVVLALPGVDAGIIAQNLKYYDRNVRIMLSTWARDDDFLTHGGSAAEGALFTEMFRGDSRRERYREFVGSFERRFGYEPSFLAGLGYESFLLISEAYGRKKRGVSLREALGGVTDFQGLQGSIALDDFGDVLRDHHYGLVRGGEYIYLEE